MCGIRAAYVLYTKHNILTASLIYIHTYCGGEVYINIARHAGTIWNLLQNF